LELADITVKEQYRIDKNDCRRTIAPYHYLYVFHNSHTKSMRLTSASL
jgi:hypothetical protein